MQTAINRWVNISLFNLLIVSFLGVILRYKIAFSLPFVDQKFMLHAHSHFAFAGWISQILMSLVVQYLSLGNNKAFHDYNKVLTANLLTSYGMLFSFPFQGYGLISIVFSTLNIFTSYWFAIKVWKDLKGKPAEVSRWIKAGVFFNALSSIGVFTLAFMMATKVLNEKIYLGAVYFFLHFQYNGWFLFTCIGLFTEYLLLAGISDKLIKKGFWIFFTACFLTFFLSTTWVALPLFFQLIVTVAAVAQLVVFGSWALAFKRKYHEGISNNNGNYLFALAGIAFGIKLVLQLASTYPPLSIYIFGFRPIIIGYLHLVLLGVITIFILGYVIIKGFIRFTVPVNRSLKVFVAGIIFNELLLMLQGVTALGYISLPHIEKFLLLAALIMFAGLLVLNTSLFNKKEAREPKLYQM